LLAALHRSLITDPMAIEGDARNPEATYALRCGFAGELFLGLAAAAAFALLGLGLMLAHQATFGFALLALAPWLPVLLVQDYWRWIGFMSRRPGKALANDAVFNCFQIGAFAAVFLLNYRHEGALIASWGFGAAAGALYGVAQYRVLPAARGGWSLLRARWSLSGWIAGSSVITWGASQMYVFIAAALLGPVGLGGLKAAQTLVAGPSGVLIQAGGSIGLPEASRAYADKGWLGLLRVARVVASAGIVSFLAVAVGIVIFGRTLLSDIYGKSFAHVEPAAILFAFAYVFIGFYLGPVLILKATRQTRWLLVVQVVSLLVSIASTVGLCVSLGVNGAALATVVTCAATAVAYRWCQQRSYRVGSQAATAGSAPATISAEVPVPSNHGAGSLDLTGGLQPALEVTQGAL
jgi:O-antigen/teichoic acid export membrane protein